MRMLLGVLITPSNDSHDTELFYQDKIKDWIFCLKRKNISSQDFFFGYEWYLTLLLTFACPVFTIPQSVTIFDPLHKAALPKLKTMGILQ